MSDIVEPLKEALRKGYELGSGEMCLIASRHMEAYIAEIERLRAELEQMREEWNELVQVAREGRRALEPKP